MKPVVFLFLPLLVSLLVNAQPLHPFYSPEPVSQDTTGIDIMHLRWLPNSHRFWVVEEGSIYVYDAADLKTKKRMLDAAQLKAAGLLGKVENIVWSNDRNHLLIYTNSSRVWRGNTKGDYWYFDLKTGKGRQIGKTQPASSLMFAKFSPDNQTVAYVSQHNLYLEDTRTGTTTALTNDGTDRIINGTFDWVYEEELACRDGFRWSPDGKQIAFWKVDASRIPFHLMINNTDSLYPFVIPIEYPKAGYPPSAVKLGVINLGTKKTNWLQIPGDPQNNYLPRMEWNGPHQVTVLQLNRLQNEARLYSCDVATGKASLVYLDKDEAWLEPISPFDWDKPVWTWVDGGRAFLWSSEKDGWRHLYKVSADGKQEQLLTNGKYDVDLVSTDMAMGMVYFMASPYDATQRYLYTIPLRGGDTVRLTPALFEGFNRYRFSPDAQYAMHWNASTQRDYNSRLIALQKHRKVYPSGRDVFTAPKHPFTMEKIRIVTADNVHMDGIMAKPLNFDPQKKYPVFFSVYGEPAFAVANDRPEFDPFIANLIPEGYIGIALDNRGTPALKGREWRKCIYKKVGVINTHDQAMAAREIFKWPFIDSNRAAVSGWSGGGNMTLNLLFRYPDIFTAGVAIAACTDQHFYDNIYTERYMGLPQENQEAYRQTSPVTYAKNLQSHLLYIHGTGDDNVHYKNAEHLINELIRHQKVFSLMVYPNRSHGIFEGEGTSEHLTATFTQFIKQYCPPGAR